MFIISVLQGRIFRVNADFFVSALIIFTFHKKNSTLQHSIYNHYENKHRTLLSFCTRFPFLSCHNDSLINLFLKDDKAYKIPGHSVPIASLGAFVLFLGFLAFNGGSELAIVGEKGHGQAVAMSFMNTIIGGAGGSVFALGLKYGVAIVKGFFKLFCLYFLNILNIIF